MEFICLTKTPAALAGPLLADGVSGVKARPAPAELARDWGTRWRPGETLRVRFLDGAPALWRRVEELMLSPQGWGGACGIRWLFDQAEDAQIRVTFEGVGGWSELGTDARHVRAPAPTMQLGGLTAKSADGDLRRMVLHEFGHALSFLHEHQSPAAKIPWNVPEVLRHYRQFGWSDDAIRANVLEGWERASNYSRYDRKSIMCYWIARELVQDARFASSSNDRLSAMDRRQAAAWYGPPYGPHGRGPIERD
jgi:hypothetical protein